MPYFASGSKLVDNSERQKRASAECLALANTRTETTINAEFVRLGLHSFLHSFSLRGIQEPAKILIPTSAGVAKLAYAADSKSKVCIFCPLLNSSELIESVRKIDLQTLNPFAGLLSHFEAF
jgi:hypothetical protein